MQTVVILYCLRNNDRKKSVHVPCRRSHRWPNYTAPISNNVTFFPHKIYLIHAWLNLQIQNLRIRIRRAHCTHRRKLVKPGRPVGGTHLDFLGWDVSWFYADCCQWEAGWRLMGPPCTSFATCDYSYLEIKFLKTWLLENLKSCMWPMLHFYEMGPA